MTREVLAAFRQTHTLHHYPVGPHVWNAIDSGAGERTIVLLPGGGASAESDFPLIQALENEFRVVALGCAPTVCSVDDAVDGIRALLATHGVAHATFLGHSLGGFFAQCFSTAYPQLVDGLILANVANYSPGRARYIKALLAGLSWLPVSALGAILRMRVKRLLNGRADRDFWLSYFAEDELRRTGRAGLVNRGRCVRDVIDRWLPQIAAAPYRGPMLILESDNDAGFPKLERAAMKQLYPQAVVTTLHGAGHLSNLTRPREFAAAVRSFKTLRTA